MGSGERRRRRRRRGRWFRGWKRKEIVDVNMVLLIRWGNG